MHCTSSNCPLSMCEVSFSSPLYFRRYAPDKQNIEKTGKGANFVNTCDRVTVLVHCTSSHCPLSMCEVSFSSPLYFQRYAPDKQNMQKTGKGANFVNTCDRVRVLVHCTSPHCPLSMCEVSFSSPLYFQRYAPYKQNIEKTGKGANFVNTFDRVTVLVHCTSPRYPLSMCEVSFSSP